MHLIFVTIYTVCCKAKGFRPSLLSLLNNKSLVWFIAQTDKSMVTRILIGVGSKHQFNFHTISKLCFISSYPPPRTIFRYIFNTGVLLRSLIILSFGVRCPYFLATQLYPCVFSSSKNTSLFLGLRADL